MALSQDALYRDMDLDLSWSEEELPERLRTKHVHRLHPYLGKFIPQLVEALLGRYFSPGQHVLDPFAGSGTTLVQALESGLDATGVDVAAFNCLLMQVKTRRYDVFGLERDLRDVVRRLDRPPDSTVPAVPAYIGDWYAPAAAEQLLRFAALAGDYAHADVLRVVVARAARSARRARHFDLDFPAQPQIGEYWCHKHRRVCRPVETADRFLRRYALDTLRRIKEFARVRSRGCTADVVHADSRAVHYAGPFDGIVTSPPYPGLIDYHEQHRYAYELLALEDRRTFEVGAAAHGASRAAVDAYSESVATVLARARSALKPRAPVVIVVNDRRHLYPAILARAGLRVDERHRRHVNRRTGRRSGEFYEDVIVARAA